MFILCTYDGHFCPLIEDGLNFFIYSFRASFWEKYILTVLLQHIVLKKAILIF